MRVLAALGIVWFHTDGAPYRQIGYAGLPVFLLIFFSLITSRSGADPTVAFLKRRWNRLLKPWLFWSLLYGVVRLAKGACLGGQDSFREMLSYETALAGTHVHLWYLPFAFVSGFLVYLFNRQTLRLNDAVVVFAATGAGLLMLTVDAVGLSTCHLMSPLPQWGFGLAAVPLGFAIGRSLMVPSYWRQRFFLAAISLMTLVTSLVLTAFCHASSVVLYSLAVMLVSLAYCWRTNGNAVVTALASLTFGVYLVHPLIILGLRHFVVADQHYAASMGLTVCISGLVTLGLMRTRIRRFL